MTHAYPNRKRIKPAGH
jgi:hypothetical protein